MDRAQLKEFILKNRESLIEKIMDQQMKLMPELKEKYNSVMNEKSRSDISHNLNYLAQAVFIDEKSIFSNYYNWLYTVLKERGIELELLKKNLLAIENVFKSEFNQKDFKVIKSFLDEAELSLENPENHYQSFIKDDNFLQQEAEEYLSYLIEMEKDKAVNYILNLVDNGTAVEDVYLKIFQTVQYEIGRLWQLDQISIAQEHYATSVTQLAMSQLYPKIFNSFKKGKKALTTCIGDELHELGIRMVADLLELNGWDTIHLGSNTPALEILKIIEEKNIDLLAISVTVPNQLEESKSLISAIREKDKLSQLKIMVGGRLFMQHKDLWQKIGADGFADDAKEAVKVADSIL
ncbi:MAG: cobalamin-dependent protein [Halanaerobium sp.]